MSTSFSSLRQTFGLQLGIMRKVTTTSIGGGSGVSAISTRLGDKKDDYYNGWYCYALGLTTPDWRQVADFTQSTGTVAAPTASPWAAQVPTSSVIEMWKYDPTLVEEAIKRAIETIYPRLYKPYINENLVTGNWLRDGGFEEWSSTSALTFYSKGHATNLTLAQETTTKLWGTYAVKCTAGAASQYLEQSATNHPWLLDLAGHSITFRAWAWTATASSSRLQVVQTDKDGTATTSSSSYHGGDSRWHLLECEDIDIDEDVRSIAFRFTIDTNSAVAYFDHARVTGPHISTVFLPRSGWQAIQGAEVQEISVRHQGDEDLDACDDMGTGYRFTPYRFGLDRDGTDTFLRYIDAVPPQSRRLRLKGASLLTVPSSETATTELDSPRTEYLLAEAAVRFYQMTPEGIGKEDLSRFREEEQRWMLRAKLLQQKHEMLLPASYQRG